MDRRKKLLIVHAPPGYGKTHLLAQWRTVLLNSGARVAWIALEQTDRIAERFVAAIASSLAAAGIDLPADLDAGRIETDAGVFLEKLLAFCEKLTHETWIIFDDWQRVHGSPAVALFESMLRQMPVNWHIAVASRGRPRFNLTHFTAQGQTIEFPRESLAFDEDEIRRLSGPSAPMPAADLARITEGWPIALQLAALRVRQGGHADRLASSFIDVAGMTDYLVDEVFSALSSDAMAFLRETAICRRFNADLIDAVRSTDDSALHIDDLHRHHGLLIAIDGEGLWYRHHPIIAEHLRRELKRLPQGRLIQLHASAATWYERNLRLFDAVEHARLSGDQARTAELVENAGCVDICLNSGAPAVRSLLENLPSDMVWQRPRLRAAQTAMNLKLGSFAQAQKSLMELQASLNLTHVDAALERDLLVVESLRLCFIDRNPTIEHLAAHRRALENLAAADGCLKGLMHNVEGRIDLRGGQIGKATQAFEQARTFFDEAGSAQGRFTMSTNLAICQMFLGRLDAAEGFLRDARLILERQLDNAPAYAAIAHTADALLLYERNELPAAGRASQLGLAGLEQAEGCLEQYLISIHVASRTAFVASGLEAAGQVIERGRRLAHFHGLELMAGLLDCLHARLLIDAAEPQLAARLMERSWSDAPSRDAGWLEADFAVPVYCLMAMDDGDLARARTLAGFMIEHGQAGGRTPAAIRAHLLMALVCAAQDDQRGARAALKAALVMGSAQAISQPFFELDRGLLRLLQDFIEAEASFLTGLQGRFLHDLVMRMVATEKARGCYDQLTAREREILTLLSQGGSNKVIARSLGLTENGVKFHLKKVFRKLDVEDRTMAAVVGACMPVL